MNGLALSNKRQTILYVRGGKQVAFQNTDPELLFRDVRAMMGLSDDTEIRIEWLPGRVGSEPMIKPGNIYGIRKEGGVVVLTEGQDL